MEVKIPPLDACVKGTLKKLKNCTKNCVKSAHFGCSGTTFYRTRRARSYVTIQNILIYQPMEVIKNPPPFLKKIHWMVTKSIRSFDVKPV